MDPNEEDTVELDYQTKPPKIDNPSSDQEQPKVPSKKGIDHKTIGFYANPVLSALTSDPVTCASLQIVTVETRTATFSKYTVYLLEGSDKNGPFSTFRRFNEFHEMRVALVKRWPGCFIPSIPDKSVIKNDDELVRKRLRYLNDFLRKMIKLPHLYQSEQFQALLRSKEKDLSSTFQQWPNPTVTEIITKYKNSFSELGGKQVDKSTEEDIINFVNTLLHVQTNISQYRKRVKQLALSRDRLDTHYPLLFSLALPNYEKNCLLQCVDGDQTKLLCTNTQQAKLLQHQVICKNVMQQNPYWLLYDFLKQQQRDCQGFIQAVHFLQVYNKIKANHDIKISQNNKYISEIDMGRSNFKSLTSKGSSDEFKFKLQAENEKLKKQRDETFVLKDIMTALLAYIEIEKYRKEKRLTFLNVISRIGGYEINLVQNIGEIWSDWANAICIPN